MASIIHHLLLLLLLYVCTAVYQDVVSHVTVADGIQTFLPFYLGDCVADFLFISTSAVAIWRAAYVCMFPSPFASLFQPTTSGGNKEATHGAPKVLKLLLRPGIDGILIFYKKTVKSRF